MARIVGGDVNNPGCPSIGGALRRLSLGVEMQLPGRGVETYFGAYLCFCADYIAAAQAAGTKEAPAKAKRPCRSCMATRNGSLLQAINYDQDVPPHARLRSHEEHLQHISCTNDPTATARARTAASLEYGVNTWGTAFKEPEIPWARSVETFPQDLSHNKLAGQFSGELHLAFKKLFRSPGQPLLTRESYNSAVAKFKFPNKAREPPPKGIHKKAVSGKSAGKDIEDDKSSALCLTMAQAQAVARFIVPLLEPLITDKTCQIWTCLKLHARLVTLLLLPSFSTADLEQIQSLIIKHAELAAKVHPKLAKKPKWHMSLHAVAEIRRFGPPRSTWTMKFEMKHQQLKKALSLFNFKNVPLTAARLGAWWLALDSPPPNAAALMKAYEEPTTSSDFCIMRLSVERLWPHSVVSIKGEHPFVTVLHRSGARDDIDDFGEFLPIKRMRVYGQIVEASQNCCVKIQKEGGIMCGHVCGLLLSTDREQCLLHLQPMRVLQAQDDASPEVIMHTEPQSETIMVSANAEPSLLVYFMYKKEDGQAASGNSRYYLV